MLPSTLASLERVDWLPVNHAANIIVELAGLGDKSEDMDHCATLLQVFHAVNPATTTWSSLVDAIASHFKSEVTVVPWSTWLATLKASTKEGDLDRNPGLKLLSFYQDADTSLIAGLELPVLDTRDTQVRSKTLRTMGPVTEEWTKQWMKQWGF